MKANKSVMNKNEQEASIGKDGAFEIGLNATIISVC